MKLRYFFAASLVILPAILLANEGAGHYEAITGRTSDFIPRVVNFLLFAGILYYLIANPVKNFFIQRKKSISNRLQEIEERLQASKKEQETAQHNLADSKEKAKEIVATAHKEAEILSRKIAQHSDDEIKALEKQYLEKKTLDERRSIRETINDVLSNHMTADDIPMSETKVVELIDKKVA